MRNNFFLGRRVKFCLALSSIIAAPLAFSAVPIDGWYSSAFGGYSYIPNNLEIVALGKLRTGASYRSGYNAGVRLGFQSNPLRYEGEFTYISAKLKEFYVNELPQRGIIGETQAAIAMANIYYDFPEMLPAIQPFAGLGLGYGWVEGSFRSAGPFVPSNYSGSNSVFAYQGTVGFTFNFAENFAFNLAYRYVSTTSVDSLGKVFQANLATVGIIYRFNEYFYK